MARLVGDRRRPEKRPDRMPDRSRKNTFTDHGLVAQGGRRSRIDFLGGALGG
jgi:hypothetical protein